jgi:hypothetical protein
VDVAKRSRVQVIVATGVWWMPQRLTRAPSSYNHVPDDSEDELDQMLVRNPRAIFEGRP